MNHQNDNQRSKRIIRHRHDDVLVKSDRMIFPKNTESDTRGRFSFRTPR